MAFPFLYRPRPDVTTRLNQVSYTPAELLEFHLRHEEDALQAPEGDLEQGNLEQKLTFLGEIAEKSKSMIDMRDNDDQCNMQCERIAAYASRSLANVRAHYVNIGPHVTEFRGSFGFVKSRVGDVLQEIKREKRLLAYSRWDFYLFAFTIFGVYLPNPSSIIAIMS